MGRRADGAYGHAGSGRGSRNPAVAGSEGMARDRVCLTLTFDHDIVDGAPAARFARRLIELIESGAGLEDEAGENGSGRS